MDTVVDGGGVVAGEAVGDLLGLGVAVDGVGLVVGEDGQDREGGDLAGGLVAGGLVGLGDGAAAVAVDADRFLTLADLPSLGLPCPESGDLRRAGALGRWGAGALGRWGAERGSA